MDAPNRKLLRVESVDIYQLMALLSPQRRALQLPRGVSDHRADRPVLRRDAPRRLRRRQARLHPHLSRTLLRIPRGHNVPAELCGHQVRGGQLELLPVVGKI